MATLRETPVEFLHLLRDLDGGAEEWLVQPLFVVAERRAAIFRPGDRLIPLHSRCH
jgi:hypothetical protein